MTFPSPGFMPRRGQKPEREAKEACRGVGEHPGDAGQHLACRRQYVCKVASVPKIQHLICSSAVINRSEMSLKRGCVRENSVPRLPGSFVFFSSELSLERDTHVTGFNIWQWYLTNSVSGARHGSNRYILRHPDDSLDDTSKVNCEPNRRRNGEELILSPAAICKDL